MRMNICVIGYSGNIEETPVKELYEFTYKLGYSIGVKGHTLWSGGRDGIMDIVSKGSYEAGGEILGVLPWDKANSVAKPSPYLKNAIFTGLDFTMRSMILLNNADLVIAIGGGSGTAVEIFGAYAYNKPLILCANTGGWAASIASLYEGQENPVYLDARKNAPVFIEQDLEGIEAHL
jgi:hypothetical protein